MAQQRHVTARIHVMAKLLASVKEIVPNATNRGEERARIIAHRDRIAPCQRTLAIEDLIFWGRTEESVGFSVSRT